jgi:hypothetical protein
MHPKSLQVKWSPCPVLSARPNCRSGLSLCRVQREGLGCIIVWANLGRQDLALLGSVAAAGPYGAGGLALETMGGEQRMLFKNGGAAAKGCDHDII